MQCTIEAAPTPIAIPGNTVQLAGEIDDTDLQWVRPDAICSLGPQSAGGRFYEVKRIVNNTGADQVLNVTAAWNDDGYLHAYTDPFDPDDLGNCIIGNDDFENERDSSQIVDLVIADGQTLVLIASTYENVAIGAYTLDVVTQTICGDSVIEGDETCDDGNSINGDGCSAQCSLEAAAVEIGAPGATVGLASSIDAGDPSWSRPNEACGGSNDSSPYDVLRIVNNTGAAQTVTVTADWSGDSYLHIFTDPFDPEDLGSCVIGNDDFGGIRKSQVTDVAIEADQVLVIVASGFADATGDYTVEVFTQFAP
ncbi:MAG: DUF4215 domain-containing protein [Myxococcales bacterium]|nr:DUF4215 domain-containing protein [Myxococcales bacterium]